MTVQVEVHGLRELRKALITTIPEHFQGKVLQQALSAGAKVIIALAKGLAPSGKTGILKRAIYAYRSGLNSNGIYEQRDISVRRGKRFQKTKRDAFYWRWIEFGRGVVRAGHRIRKARLGATRDSKTKAKVLGTPAKGFFGKEVRAVSPRPFMRPAFDRGKLPALEQIRSNLATQIPIVARKASWRTPSR